MITIQEALSDLKRANDISYNNTAGATHADLGDLYLNAANALLMAMQQANMNADPELAATVLSTYNRAAGFFMRAISETADRYGAVNIYLSVEVAASAADFILNGNLDVGIGIVGNLMKVDAVLTTSVAPYAAAELLQKYAKKSAGAKGHYGLANALYELSTKHFERAMKDSNLSAAIINLYKKTLQQWQKLTEKLLDIAKELKNEPRELQYECQKDAIKKSMAKIPSVVPKKSFFDESLEGLENVTPSSKIKRRSRPQ